MLCRKPVRAGPSPKRSEAGAGRNPPDITAAPASLNFGRGPRMQVFSSVVVLRGDTRDA